ncbi:MAG: rRNA pseudouridine synthase [Acidobacteria bacterium]|nr:rRNA pseudouridine synthase [Acidobacteriota bacterium]
MAEERLQKILSMAGIASRRKAEVLITEGRVTVNGKVVTQLGTKAALGRDHIKVDGKLIQPPREFVYLALNKPVGYVTTVSDPEGRPTIMELVRGLKTRVYPVGRLDFHSEGLILLTNDGDFANAIMSAKTKLVKTYVVKVNGTLTLDQEEEFRRGVSLSGKRTAPAGLKRLKAAANPWYEVKLTEGRQNQIRMMFRNFGLLVEKLKRVKIGFLELGSLRPRSFRSLEPEELNRFFKVLKLKVADDDE